MSKVITIKFYTGGVDIKDWGSLSPEQKKDALSKSWYVRWWIRDPKSGKMVRQTNVKRGLNRFHSKEERLLMMESIAHSLRQLITLPNEVVTSDPVSASKEKKSEDVPEEGKTIHEAIDFALALKKRAIGAKSYGDYVSRSNRFLKFIGPKKKAASITNKDANNFLNSIAMKQSAKTRNNYRADLSALFAILFKNEIVPANVFKDGTEKEQTHSKTDRTFSNEMLGEMASYLTEVDPVLLHFIKLVAYNFLRPIEVCRLTVDSVNLKEQTLYFYPKNKPTKIKRIPDILMEQFRQMGLSDYPSNAFLFTPSGVPGPWDTLEVNRRDYFTKRFKTVVKDHFGLGKEYGIYSFRHTYITNIFRHLRTKKGLTYQQAVEHLMPITGHDSKSGLENYLHKIDAEIPADWSSYIEVVL